MTRKKRVSKRLSALYAAVLLSLAGGSSVFLNAEGLRKPMDKTVRAVPLGRTVKPIVTDVLGEDYRRRANYTVDMPTGLLVDGHLTYPCGTEQAVLIGGELSQAEIAALAERLTQTLRGKTVSGVAYAPLYLRVYDRQFVGSPGDLTPISVVQLQVSDP